MKFTQDVKELALIANTLRQDTIKSLVKAKSGHTAGPLGMADVFTVVYFSGIFHHTPEDPADDERDRVLLSNGHICPILYTSMAHAGYFPVDELKTLRQLGTRLQGHPHRETLPGLETTSGPLGEGTSQGAGMAKAFKIDGKKNRVVVLASDGEQDAGNTWEGAMFAGKEQLDNLVVVMDRNNIQIDGWTEDIMPLEPLADKYRAFNWHVIEVDGHNIEAVMDAFKQAEAVHQKPTMILAYTVPGKGVGFMENDYTWHGKPPTEDEAKIALKELAAVRKKIQANVYT